MVQSNAQLPFMIKLVHQFDFFNLLFHRFFFIDLFICSSVLSILFCDLNSLINHSLLKLSTSFISVLVDYQSWIRHLLVLQSLWLMIVCTLTTYITPIALWRTVLFLNQVAPIKRVIVLVCWIINFLFYGYWTLCQRKSLQVSYSLNRHMIFWMIWKIDFSIVMVLEFFRSVRRLSIPIKIKTWLLLISLNWSCLTGCLWLLILMTIATSTDCCLGLVVLA